VVIGKLQVAGHNFFSVKVFANSQLGTEAVEQPRMTGFELPRTDKGFLIRLAREVDDFQADKDLIGLRDIDGGMNVIRDKRSERR
jgi:hypothetical protein